MRDNNTNLDQIRVDKGDLVARLEENLAAHVEEHKVALEGYNKAVTERLRELLGAAETGETVNLSSLHRIVRPIDYREQYVTVIEMLKWSRDGAVVLNRREFEQYVQDKWEWTNSFKASNSAYLR